MNRLKDLRAESKLSLRQLQSHTGIDFSRLAKIEKEDLNIENKTLEKLLNFFEIDYTFFYGGDGIIIYHNQSLTNSYPIPYKQFESILRKYPIKVIIKEKKLIRIISDEALKEIDNILDCQDKALSVKRTTMKFIDYLDGLDPISLRRAKEDLDDFFTINKNKL